MTTFDRGDTVLISYPDEDGGGMHLRPALVLHNVLPNDSVIAVVPITPDPVHLSPSIFVQEGSFEAARLGLITSGYLNACSEVVVDRKFVNRKIGKCPWRLMQEFLSSQQCSNRDWGGSGADRFLMSHPSPPIR
ncbi:MAG: hypothetical protein KIT83_10875 [Bryobacterales bacterium]|nr:hypothetical protein [Bryobacterales bacterium]